LLIGLALILVGCKGLPTASEKQARQQAADIAAAYRPSGNKPALPTLTANSSLQEFLTFALFNHPKIEAAYFDWSASVERITTARSLPDPQITFQMDIQNIVTSIMPGLMMSFPGPGKLRAGADVASAESDARYFAFQSAVLDAAFAVKQSFFQLYFLDEKIRVNRETLALLGDLEKLARAQNAVGKVTLQDILRAQIEKDRLTTEVANLEDSKSSLKARFKEALGLQADQADPPVPQHLETASVDLDTDALLETAYAQNPRIAAMKADVRRAEAAIALARKGRIPDFSAGLMADVKLNPILYRPLGTVTLPIWRDKIAAQIAEAQANKSAAEARLTAEQISLAVDLAEKSFMLREARRNLLLLDQQLLPKARQSLEVARIAYLSGRLDFFNLSDSERTLLGFQLDQIDARNQRELASAQISLLILGTPPEASLSPKAKPQGPESKAQSPKSMAQPPLFENLPVSK
jgi:outer membrane protein TolC